jgi:hypothetical protein
MELISQAEWAKNHGFSKQYAGQLVKNGTIRLFNGKVNPKQADSAIAAIRNPAHEEKRAGSNSGGHGEGGDLSTLLLKTRIKNEVEKGKLLETRVKTETRELVSAESVREAAFNKGRIIRDGMLNIPDRVSSLIASVGSDERKIHEILAKEIRLVLEELSRDG